jgi:dolichol-phosphate mannosyltransferase
MKISDQLISVVVPVYNEAKILPSFLTEIFPLLRDHYDQFEVLLIDNGSDDSTEAVVNGFLRKWNGLRYLRLSRRFDTATAFTAGVDMAIGDVCVTLLPATDPVSAIPELVRKCLATKALVVGECRVEASWPSRICSRSFHFFCSKILGVHFPRHSTFFAALPRSAVQQMAKVRDKVRFLTTLHSHLGMPYSIFPYQAKTAPRRGTFLHLWISLNAALDLVVLNTTHPLRIVTIGSLLLSFGNLLYMGYIAAVFFFKTHPAEGWVTASSQNALNFFLLFLTLSVLSEYLGRLLMESKDKPSYYIVEERHSLEKVSGEKRRNTLSEARIYS